MSDKPPCEAEVGSVEESPLLTFLKEISLEKSPQSSLERGISTVSHLEDVSESDADEFKFLTKFEFRRLLRNFNSHKESEKNGAKEGKAVSCYRTSNQPSVITLPRAFRNFV